MPILIREYRDEDWPQVAAIWSLAFFAGEPITRDHRVFRHADAAIFAAEDEEQIVGAANLIRMQCSCRGAWLPCAGLAVVGVAPEHRLQGVGSSLMHWLVGRMRREGFPIAALHAASADFYRGFGYALAGQRLEFDVPLSKLPRLHEDLPIHRLTLNDWPELAPCYRAFAAPRSGMIARDDLRNVMFGRLAEMTPTILAVGKPVEAYAVLQLNKEWFLQQQVAELVWSTPRGWRAILEALRMLCINAAALSWCEPADGPYQCLHAERNVPMKSWLPVMYRALDVSACLRALNPAGSGSFTLAVDDELIAQNRGPWHVVFGDGGVHVSPAPEAALTMSVGAFTQALLGQPSFAALAELGAIQGDPASADFAAATLLLPPHPVYCIDFF